MLDPVERASSTSPWSYLNPFNLLKIPSHVYQVVSRILGSARPGIAPDLSDRPVVVFKNTGENPGEENVLFEDSRYAKIYEYFDRADLKLDLNADPYKLIEFPILNRQGKEIKLRVARAFLSDLERCGERDRFFIDGKEIDPPPKTDEQKRELLIDMLERADGDVEVVANWTRLWNLRGKFILLDTLRERILSKHGLDPSMTKDSSSETSFNTKTGALSCTFSGVSVEGTTPDLNPESFVWKGKPIRLNYSGALTYEAELQWLEEKIFFTDEPVYSPKREL